jgi:hypothetical protein
MACSCSNQTIAGLCKDCEGSLGGIVTVYLANYQDNIFTVTSGAVSAVNSAVSFYEYQFRKNTGSMTSTLNIDPANGVNFVSTDLDLIFSRMETKKRIEMAALSVGQLAGIVKDANGKYYALGVSEPLEASAGDGQTGTARTDGNRYHIVLTDNQESFPPLIPDDVMATVTIVQATN